MRTSLTRRRLASSTVVERPGPVLIPGGWCSIAAAGESSVRQPHAGTTGGTMRMGWAARRWSLRRNPLRRRTDRIETSLTLLVALILVTLGPLLVWRVGAAGYRDAVAQAERAARVRLFEVPGVLLDDADKYRTTSETSVDQGPVPARWTAPDGTARTGSVVPPPDAPSGSVVPVTVDVHGIPTQPPVRPDPVGSVISLACAN